MRKNAMAEEGTQPDSCRGVNANNESEESDSSENESSSSADSDYGEPVLKYKRFAKEVVASTCTGPDGTSNVISCIAVHPKFIALGTHDGTVKLLDHTGTFLKDRVYSLHSQAINQIAVDEEGEFLATAANDGKVNVNGLFVTKYNLSLNFDKQVKSVAIHPHFSKSTNRVLVLGIDKLIMVEERRWPLGNKFTDLHAGGGTITAVKWKEAFIAWANQSSKVVMVYNTTTKEMIASISFEVEGNFDYPTCLYWQSSITLLAGSGHFVKTVTVKEVEQSLPHSSEVEPSRRKKYMVIVGQNIFPKSIVCGVAPLYDDDTDGDDDEDKNGWKLVVLGYPSGIDEKKCVMEGCVPPPHLMVVPVAHYNKTEERFEQPPTLSNDKLLPRGHQYCRSEEFYLDCVLREDKFYILTPIDIIVAQKRNELDHIQWLLDERRFIEAMNFAENPNVASKLPTGTLQDIGIQYAYHLLRCGKYAEAAKKCGETLGKKDKKRWEDFILDFLDKGQLHIILPFIPQKEPQLSPAVYELVLNTFLQEDSEMLYKIIQTWSTSLYNPQAIINAVEDKLKQQLDDEQLLKVKAILHEDLGQYDEALKIYLQRKHMEVFDLIQKRKLYQALVTNLIRLMKLDTKKTVELLIEHRNEPSLQIQRVVNELDTPHTTVYLHEYLDRLFLKDPKAGGHYHQRQVELYAQYDTEKLLHFLRSCNDIPLQKALLVCEHYERYEEMVFLLARMGNREAALKLVIEKLRNVDKAIEFAMEEGDDDLWNMLIQLSVQNAKFVTGLLNNVGTHIDPTKLIQQIPEKKEIPNLGASLVKLMQDFQVQVNLREGCRKILVKDSHNLMEKLFRLQSTAVFIDDDTLCKTCGNEVIGIDERASYVMFFCGHVYHERCVNKRNEVMTCRMCYVHTIKPKQTGKN